MSVLERLAAATAARRSETICLDGAAQAEWDATFLTLEAAAIEDEKAGAGSLASATPHTRAVIEQLEEIRERIQASEVTFVFEQIGWTKRLAIQAQHPPRDGHLADQWRQYNVDTFIPTIIKASCVEVTDADSTATEIPGELWNQLLGWVDDDGTEHKGTLNLQQVDTLFNAAFGVNDQGTKVPTSARSLLTSQDSGASSTQPSPGKSRRSGSAAGSRRTSPKSSATKKAASSGS